ncbi:MAG: hypothetical protein CMJ70_24915 [Planctomycetaceae bacterium]|nr:hypothetical protein [Planctomycetaceae bacterium]
MWKDADCDQGTVVCLLAYAINASIADWVEALRRFRAGLPLAGLPIHALTAVGATHAIGHAGLVHCAR